MQVPRIGAAASALGKKPLTLQTVLLTLIVIAAIPPLLFSGILLLRYAASERLQAQQQLEESAKGLARGIDAEFGATEAVLLALAASTRLANDDLQGFERQLRSVAAATGRQFELGDTGGRIVISTSGETRQAPPPSANAGPTVSDVQADSQGTLSARVTVPIVRDGILRWTLHATIRGEEFNRLLTEPGVPRDWIVSLVDRNGIHLARSHFNDRYAGKPLVPALVAHLKERKTGTLSTVSLEGIPLVSTVAYAPKSGWAAAIGLPEATLTAPLREQLTHLAALGILVAATALGAGLLVARLLNGSVEQLGLVATRVGAGELVEFAPSALREVNHLGAVLEKTSRELETRSRSLSDLNATLEDQVKARTAELQAANAKLQDEIERRKQSEIQVRQMQKLEAVGQLTGGIAHDFNNMLAIIMSSLRLMQRRLERGETKVQDYIDGALRGADRAANLVSRLLAFSRQQPLSPQATDANKLLAGMEDVLRRTIPESIRIEIVRAGGLWSTYTDPHGLESALVNLAVNARDAMPGGGKLTIETANAYLDEAYAAIHPEVTAGQYVLMAVTDTGHGMDGAVQSRVFEPFFTTKPAGSGTGLGLSQVFGFIKQSGGHVKIYSEVGVGTTVKLYLPRLADREGAEAIPATKTPAQPTGNGQTILVVEDDDDVRRLTVDILTELKYTVLSASNGAHALDIMDQHPELALLLTDVVMPDMNGRELADHARRRRPGIKVLFTTGYTRNAIVHNGTLDEGVQLIIKPFTLEGLAAKVVEVLGPHDE